MLTVAAAQVPRRRLSTVPGAEAGALAEYRRIPRAVRWSFIAFAAAMPFEATEFAFNTSAISVARVTGLLFIASYLFYYNPLSGKRSLPPGSAALSWFLVYLLVFIVNGLFLDAFYYRQFVSILFTLSQLYCLFWISSSLLRAELLARRALLGFAAGAVLCAGAALLHLPGFATVLESRVGERLTVMDANPNYVAYTMAVAAVIFIGTAMPMKLRYSWMKVLVLAPVLPLLAFMVQSGSRTALAAFAIGLAAFMFPNRHSRGRLLVVFLAVFIAAALVYMLLQHPTVLTRFEDTFSGNLAGRQIIIPASLDMIFERPLLGWQPVAYWQELGRRVGQIWGARDAHNLLFHLLLEVGLVGTVPFLIGLWLCMAGAWRARNGKLGTLPFALLAMTLSANLSHTYLARKPQWLILGLAVAAAASVARRSVAARYLVRRPLQPGRAARTMLVSNGRPRAS
jgi:O-antigen ligase